MYKTDHLTSSCLPLLSSIHLGGCHVLGRSPYSIMFAIVVKYLSWWLSCTRQITLQHHLYQIYNVFILVAVMYKEDHLTASCLPLFPSIHFGGCHVQVRSPYSIILPFHVKYSPWWLSCTRLITLQHHVCHCCQIFILVAVMYKEGHLTASCLPLLSSIHLGGCHVQGSSPYGIMFAIVVKYSSWWLSCTSKVTLQHHVCHFMSSIHLGGCHVQDRSPYNIMFAIVVKCSSWWL